MFINKKSKLGFTLIEMLLVVSVITIFSMMRMQDIQEEQIDIKSKIVAEQIKQVGNATNSYISLHYSDIVNLTSIASGDASPLTCNKGKKTCKINIDTLKNDFLLPKQFKGENILKSGYDITLKVEGSAPNYQVNGLVVTNKGLDLNKNKNNILLGKTIQYAGIDSGYSSKNNEINGLYGNWKETNVSYPSIKDIGQLAYYVGYKSNMYSIYLRRDGTLPMTGDLNLDEHNINNIANAYIHKNLNVDGNSIVKGNSSIDGDLNVKGNISSDKVIKAKGEIQAGSWIRAKNGYGDTISIGGDNANNDYEIYLSSINKPISIHRAGGAKSDVILRTTGGIETKAGGQIISSGNITSDQKIIAKGRIQTGEYVQIDGKAVLNGKCDNNGLIAKDTSGAILSCFNSTWIASSNGDFPVGSPIPWPSNVPPTDWLIANGQTFDKALYPKLAKIYPSGKLPDLRGVFIRGLDNGKGLDDEKNRALLSYQKDQDNMTYNTGGWLKGHHSGMAHYYKNDKEIRVKNIAFNYIIKAR